MTTQRKATIEEVLRQLIHLTERVEEVTVDVHSMKIDLKDVKLRLHTVEMTTSITKIDVENIKQNTNDLIMTSDEILANMVTQKEFAELSHRVSSLERTTKSS